MAQEEQEEEEEDEEEDNIYDFHITYKGMTNTPGEVTRRRRRRRRRRSLLASSPANAAVMATNITSINFRFAILFLANSKDWFLKREENEFNNNSQPPTYNTPNP